jgi:hypothetical protein
VVRYEKRSLVAKLVGAALAAATPLHALAPEPAALEARGSAIDIVVVGSENDVVALSSTLGPNDFRGAGARIRRDERLNLDALLRAGGSDALVRCYVDLSTSGRADLYFADRDAERFLLRRVALPDGLDDVGRETLGEVLTLSVLALLDHDAATLNRDEARALIEEQRPQAETVRQPRMAEDELELEAERPASRSSAAIGLEPYYSARIFASEAVLSHGPGLDIGWVAGAGSATHAAWLGVAYELERELHADPASMTWSTLTLRGAYEHLSPVGAAVALGARAGAGIDWLRFTPGLGTNESVELRGESVTTSLLLHLGVGARVALGTRLHASLRVFADFYPTRARYSVERVNGDGVDVDVLEPFRMRPGVTLGLLLR